MYQIMFKIIILISCMFTINTCSKNTPSEAPTLRVAFPLFKSINEYDPSRITYIPEYMLLKNIYSTLVELDLKGNLISGIAQKYYWKNDELHFDIHPNLKTVDGMAITGEDVETSLKRLMILSTNPHGNLKTLLCPNLILKSLNDPCPGIIATKDKVILKPQKKFVFLLPMLASVDFSIIPKSSLDMTTLKIIDYRNTSGVYYLEKDIDSKNLQMNLAVNKNHYHYSAKIPHKIILVPSGRSAPKNAIELFRENLVDCITTADIISTDHLIDLASQNTEAQIHQTLDMEISFLNFTQKGIKQITEKNRFILAKKIRALFHELTTHYKSYRPVNQYFLSFGEGAISGEQEQEFIHKLESASDDLSINQNIKGDYLLVTDLRQKLESKLNEINKNVKTSSASAYPDPNTHYNDRPDFHIAGVDSGFQEDIGLVSFIINNDRFGLGKEKGKKWLDEYVQIENKQERIEKLRELHYSALIKGFFFPLMSSSFAAIIRKGWSFDFSKTQVSLPLWKIQKEN